LWAKMFAPLSEEERKRFLRALEQDEEFRYAVAGLVGLTDILKRLEQHDRKFNEIIARLEGHDKKFNEVILRLEEHDKKFNEVILRLEEHDRKFAEIVTRLSEVTTYIERTSLTIEEEAREVISYRLRALGIDLKLSNLLLPDLEINIYGANQDVCVVGEASTRAGSRVIRKLDEDVTRLRLNHPEYLRRKVVKVLYTMYATPDAVQEAREGGVWLLKATEDLTPPTI
jgi:hypothetical protein